MDEERLERIRKLRESGLTYAAIAAEVGGISPQRVQQILKPATNRPHQIRYEQRKRNRKKIAKMIKLLSSGTSDVDVAHVDELIRAARRYVEALRG